VATNLPTPDDPFAVPLHRLPGVSDHRAELLCRLGVRTVGELLFHFPRAYEDLSDRRGIADLTAGTIQTVEGEIVEIESRDLSSGGFVVSVVLSDGGPTCLEGVWFNQAGAARRFRYGLRVAFSGKPRWFRDRWQMNNPRVSVLDGDNPGMWPAVVPVYPLTEDLRPETLRPLIGKALDRFASAVADVLPEALRRRHDWPPVAEALRAVHFPESVRSATHCRRRFVYEEFLVLQLALGLRRREVRDRRRAPVLTTTPAIDAHIRRLFPFKLTGDQEKAVADVARDLANERPMQRLVQADVGAGKTAVAVYGLLVAVANKYQAALMAPTEVLARQHFRTLETYLAHSRVRRLLLTGSLTTRERAEARDRLRRGDVDLVIGTQSLVQEEVQFAKLGLVVIDEQHKFGVHQRARVRRLGADPHYLVMTATPIPRTVALTVFGDLDVTVIREMPPGRQKVVTRWMQAAQRDWVHGKLRDGLAQGRQAYVVCPLVEESAALDVKAATETCAELRAGPFRDFRLGLLHGRMDEEEKAAVMQDFRDRKLDLLVCTQVVEVGVDVANATLMVIEHAERFGLSQLHQLRGRISRGEVAGQCWFFAEPGGDESQERLKAFVRTSDGFALAEADVRLRGAGEFFGTRQHGLGEIRLGNLVTDADLLTQARKDAFALVSNDAALSLPEHALLRRAVLERYGQTLELAEVG
jgi:ATP-dependent DNA helicase RecG